MHPRPASPGSTTTVETDHPQGCVHLSTAVPHPHGARSDGVQPTSQRAACPRHSPQVAGPRPVEAWSVAPSQVRRAHAPAECGEARAVAGLEGRHARLHDGYISCVGTSTWSSPTTCATSCRSVGTHDGVPSGSAGSLDQRVHLHQTRRARRTRRHHLDAPVSCQHLQSVLGQHPVGMRVREVLHQRRLHVTSTTQQPPHHHHRAPAPHRPRRPPHPHPPRRTSRQAPCRRPLVTSDRLVRGGSARAVPRAARVPRRDDHGPTAVPAETIPSRSCASRRESTSRPGREGAGSRTSTLGPG